MNTHRTQRPMAIRKSIMCLRTVGSLALVGLMASCAPAPPSDESLQSTIVITLRAPQVDFGLYRTYHLRPEIRELTVDGIGTTTLSSSVSGPLLDETRRQMTARGYESVDREAGADLAVEMIYVSSEWVSTYCYSWWDPYYWGYPGWSYYPYYNCTGATWQTNTLATMMTDLSAARDGLNRGTTPDAQSAQALSGIWFSGISGLIFSASDSLQKGIDGIGQAYTQSPYLARR
jgi:hypothetical protein